MILYLSGNPILDAKPPEKYHPSAIMVSFTYAKRHAERM